MGGDVRVRLSVLRTVVAIFAVGMATSPVVAGASPSRPELTRPALVTPSLQPQATHRLVLTFTGPGSVVSRPAGIACPGSCSADFADGTQVTLGPTPASGSTFTDWSGDCTLVASFACIVTMDADKTVSASFVGAGPTAQKVEIDGDGRTNAPQGTSIDIDVARKSSGRVKGEFEFSSRYSNTRFESTRISTLDANGNTATFKGTGELNHASGYMFIVTVTDSGRIHNSCHDRLDGRCANQPNAISIVVADASNTIAFTTNGEQPLSKGNVDVELRSGPTTPLPRFTSSPSSGGAGVTIGVSSLDPCPAPAGAGHWVVETVFTTDSAGTFISSGSIPVNPDGSWASVNQPLTINEVGPAHISARCYDLDQLVGAITYYAANTFTVG